MNRQICYKQLAIKLFEEGHYGNTIKTWFDLKQWEKDSLWLHPMKEYVIRQHKREAGGSGVCVYNLRRLSVLRWLKNCEDTSLYFINEAMPDQEVRLQGEYTDAMGYPSLHYSCYKAQMRDALEIDGHHMQGPFARIMVKCAMCEQAYEEFTQLLDRYSRHTIEFSCYRVEVGHKNWNTVIWEVRDY